MCELITPIVSINTNYTWLASSSATNMISKYCISDRNMTDGMAGDDTSGKKKLYKNLIYNEFTFTYVSSDNEKWTEMSKNIVLTYSDIWIYINTFNIYMSCHTKG